MKGGRRKCRVQVLEASRQCEAVDCLLLVNVRDGVQETRVLPWEGDFQIGRVRSLLLVGDCCMVEACLEVVHRLLVGHR